MKESCVLITGANGFIGRELLHLLIGKRYGILRALDINDLQLVNPAVSSFKADINNPPESIFENVDIVIHLASVIGVNYTENHPIQTIETIVNGTKKILELSVKHRVSRIIMASSSEVYGDNPNGPIRESDPVSPKSIYGSAKLTAEYLCKAYQREHGLDYTILRIFNVFGKDQSNNFVIPMFIEKALVNEPIGVFGTGDQTRSFCHVADVARCAFRIMETDSTRNHTYNVGDPSNQISIRDLAKKIIRLVKDSTSSVEFIPMDSTVNRDPEREIYHRLPNVSALKAATGYLPMENFNERLMEIIEYKRNGCAMGT